MSEFSFKTKGVTNDGDILISAKEVQELLYDIHDDHLSALQVAKVEAVREFAEQYADMYDAIPKYAEMYIEQLKEQGE